MASPEKSLGKKSKPKSKEKKGKRKIRHTHIEHADNGGFLVHHQYDGGEPGEDSDESTHALADNNQLLAHMQDTVGGQLPQQGAGPEAGAGAQAAAPAAPGPGM